MKASVTDGQLGQLAVKQHELFRRAKEGSYASLDDVLAALQQVIEGQAPTLPIRKEKAKPILLVLANEQVEYLALETPHDPHAFYQTRNGLHVWDEFNKRVLANVKSVERFGACTGTSYDLRKNASDNQITAELTEGCKWDPSELCARIAQMIEKQWDRKDGDLLNNGYANLFYVPGSVVSVYWNADDRTWEVRAWKLDDSHWRAGLRVFVRN